MLVGEVLWTRPVRVPGILSETSPVPGSAIATSDDQVSDAQRISCVSLARSLAYTGGAANAVRVGKVGRTRPVAMPAPPASNCRREGYGDWFMGDLLGVAGTRSAGRRRGRRLNQGSRKGRCTVGGQHTATGALGRGEGDPLSLHLPSVEPVRSAQLWDSRTLLAFHARRRPHRGPVCSLRSSARGEPARRLPLRRR